MKKISILLIILSLTVYSASAEDTRYNENLNTPQGVGSSGNVSVQTGAFSFDVTDIALPGLNGLNFEATRTYSSTAANVYNMRADNRLASSTTVHTPLDWKYGLGCGWSFGWPFIFRDLDGNEDTYKLNLFWGGSVFEIDKNFSPDKDANNLEYYYVKDIRIVRDDSAGYETDETDGSGLLANKGVRSAYCLEIKSGTRYYFSAAGNLMCIKNPGDPGDAKQAVIWFYYKGHTQPASHDQYNAYRQNAKIELAVDSIGRRIDFTYGTTGENWLESISYDVTVNGQNQIRSVRYQHQKLTGVNAYKINSMDKTRETVPAPVKTDDFKFTLSGFKNQLQVLLPGDECTRYEYELYQAPFSFNTNMGGGINYFVNLTKIYSNYTNSQAGSEALYKNCLAFEYNAPAGNHTEYQRPFATVSGYMSIFKVTRQYASSKKNQAAAPELFNDTRYTYHGNTYGKPLNEYWTVQTSGGVEKTSVFGANNREEEDNLLEYEETLANNGSFKERVEYTYDSRKTLTSKSLFRNGVKKYTEEFIYNDYNDLINHKAPNGLVTEMQYHPKFHVPLDVIQREIRNGDGTLFDVRKTGEIRESDGKVLSETLFAALGEKPEPIKVQKITYDRYGNPEIVEDAAGNTVKTIFDPVNHIFPEIMEMKVTLDNKLKTVRGYKLFNTDGTVRIEWDNDGYAIEHAYDVLGTEIKTILPDENDKRDFEFALIDTAGDLLTADWIQSRTNNGFVEMQVDYREESVITYGEEFGNTRVKTGKFADGLGHVLKEVLYENAGNNTEYSVKYMNYDHLGRMIALTDPDAGPTARTRRVMGEEIQAYDKTWLVWYDDLGRKTQVEYPDDSGILVRKRVSYDDVNLTVTTTNTRGYNTEETYDIDGNLIKILQSGLKNEMGEKNDLVYSFEYNQLKQKTAFTDPLGERVTYSFDERGLMTRLDYGNGSDLMTYDKRGNLVTKTDRNESLIRFFYDEMGRNVEQRYFTAANYQEPYDYIRLGYDGRGNLVKVDGARLLEEMSYDSRARLLWVDRTYKDAALREELAGKLDWVSTADAALQKFRFAFTYTPNNLVDKITMPDGKSIRFRYDPSKLRLAGLDAEADPVGDGHRLSVPVITNLQYNKGGQVTRMRYANNTTQAWEFDARKLIKNIKVTNTQTEILKLEYKLDTEGNILAINNNTFAYDEVNRLVKSDIMHLGYVDNRLHVKAAFGTSLQAPIAGNCAFNAEADFNKDNRVDGYDHTYACANWQDPFDREQFTYDNSGNRLKLIQNKKEYIYHYGPRNRLLKVERIDKFDQPWQVTGTGLPVQEVRTVLEYTYDANGNTTERKEHNDDGTVTVYNLKYDIHNRLTTVLKNNVPHASYIYDNAGMRMYKEENGKRTYYFRNGGTVLYEVEIDDAKQELIENSYLVSGELIAGRVTRKNGGTDELFYYHLDHLNSTKMVTDKDGKVVLEYEYRAFGTELDKIGTDPNRFSYIGREFDEEINLYYLNARYYDATIGRFINVDPIQDGINWYVYCNNNPLNTKDPSGLSKNNNDIRPIAIYVQLIQKVFTSGKEGNKKIMKGENEYNVTLFYYNNVTKRYAKENYDFLVKNVKWKYVFNNNNYWDEHPCSPGVFDLVKIPGRDREASHKIRIVHPEDVLIQLHKGIVSMGCGVTGNEELDNVVWDYLSGGAAIAKINISVIDFRTLNERMLYRFRSAWTDEQRADSVAPYDRYGNRNVDKTISDAKK